MEYRRLFILIEGDDDERFFDKIIVPMFGKKYDTVMLWKYAQEKNEKIINFLKSIKAMDADYIYVADNNGSPCITDRKQKVKEDFKSLEDENILVVVREIESWYLSGMSKEFSEKCGIKSFLDTEQIAKSTFNELKPKKFDSRIDFMLEILKFFCIDTAKSKNKSFCYFVEKFV